MTRSPSRQSRDRRWLLASAATCVITLSAGCALAQTSSSEAPATASGSGGSPDSGNVSEVVVTGTLIRGVAPTGSNLVSVTPKDIQASGATSVEEVMETLPELSNFGQSFQPAVPGAQSGAFNVSIRNLETLVLIDGHRVPASGTLSTQPDPNSIPAIALQRVEVVPDGTSALYGSDAVGGVVNFITKQNFDGVETDVRYGVADEYSAWDVSVLGGKTWSGGSALIAYEYTANTPLNGLQRPGYSVTDLAPYGGIDNRSNGCAQPNVTAGGVNYAYPGLLPNTTNLCEEQRIASLLYGNQRNSVFANVHQDINSNIDVWAQANYSYHTSSGNVEPLPIDVTIPNTNPYFQPIAGTNATSETVNVGGQSILGTNYFTDYTKNRVVEVTAGTDVKLPSDWGLKAFVNYGNTYTQGTEAFSLNDTALDAAAAGTTTSTALDPFGSATSPSVVQAIGNWDYITATTQTLAQGQVVADGPLFSLPGGVVKLAVGAEVREEGFSSNFVNGPAGSPLAASVSANRVVLSTFGELLVPLVGDENAVPLVRGLNLSAAGRYDHYSDFGSTANPKIGVDWTLVDGVKLRGSWGTSFHAPDLSDLHAIDGKFVTLGYPVSSIFFGQDPVNPGGYNAYVVAGGNPNLKPETAQTYSVGADFEPKAVPGFKFSVTYYNVNEQNLITIPPLSNAIFSNPAFAKFMVRNPTAAQIASYSAGLPQVLYAPIDPALPTTLFDLRRQNLASLFTNGLDFNAQYSWDSSIGRFQLSEMAERILDFSEIPAPGSAPSNLLDEGLPAWRSRTMLYWTHNSFAASVMENYNGALTNQTELVSGLDTYELPAVITTDLYFSYSLPGKGLMSGVQLTVNVENLFNASPPIGAGGVRTDVNVIGRLVWLGVRKKW
jgi:iron complex outermembrane receptor protein